MKAAARLARQKISTTISPKTFGYLERLIKSRQANTLADAIDLVVEQLLIYENRQRLAEATAAYFANLPDEGADEEHRLGSALAQSARGLDVDRDP